MSDHNHNNNGDQQPSSSSQSSAPSSPSSPGGCRTGAAVSVGGMAAITAGWITGGVADAHVGSWTIPGSWMALAGIVLCQLPGDAIFSLFRGALNLLPWSRR